VQDQLRSTVTSTRSWAGGRARCGRSGPRAATGPSRTITISGLRDSSGLVGVEFAINAAAWCQADPPVVAGQPFDPPNPNHPSPLVQTSYTLHV
jgi:hypothetical protein